MSTKFNDINDFAIFEANTAPSGAVITAVTGAVIDMQTVANNNCFAIQVIGTVAGTQIVFVGQIQESPTTTAASFTNISGAAFSTITSTTGANIVQLLNFQRTQPFVRYINTITGTTSSVALDVLIGGQKGQL